VEVRCYQLVVLSSTVNYSHWQRFLTVFRLTKMSLMVLADQVEKEGKVLDLNRKGTIVRACD
jgi:hypothetical protein